MKRLGMAVGAAALLGSLLVGCGKPAQQQTGPLTAAALKKDACSAYTTRTMLSVLTPALRGAGWPAMKPVGQRGASRVSDNVQRCLYRLLPTDHKLSGDQQLNIYIYNEQHNGGRLMSACMTRPLATAAPVRIGDETCVGNTGQLRFRIGEDYVSVLVETPPRTISGTQEVGADDTRTFVAPTDPAARAALAAVVAQDLVQRWAR
ncbi:hypothetical protein ABT297_00330 [Dactylosporangium sp. NPDC000555]|uniref:hypothetical protein n=1 Tax=Dactylosporangium sp. NPDC000555 TaxID=3154260 RepID=UPI0033342F51